MKVAGLRPSTQVWDNIRQFPPRSRACIFFCVLRIHLHHYTMSYAYEKATVSAIDAQFILLSWETEIHLLD